MESSLLDHGRHEDISEELKADPAKKKLSKCRVKW
jgi:hypothetical protein